MSTLGRNDPCTCGSGKKYKKCCLHRVRDGDKELDEWIEQDFALGQRLLQQMREAEACRG
jgi:hypothetical protein